MYDGTFNINFHADTSLHDPTIVEHKVVVYPGWSAEANTEDEVDHDNWLGVVYAVEPKTDKVEYTDEWLWSTYLYDMQGVMPDKMRKVIEMLMSRFNTGERGTITLQMTNDVSEAFPYAVGAELLHATVDSAI